MLGVVRGAFSELKRECGSEDLRKKIIYPKKDRQL